jgi:DNA-binding NarL/FixJ family response regulator
MPTVAFLTNDLLFQSRLSSMATASKVQLVADRAPERLIAKLAQDAMVKLIIVDLTLDTGELAESLATLKNRCPGAISIAYGPHVHEAKLQRAVEAGFDQVMTRGQFDRQMQAILCSAAAE